MECEKREIRLFWVKDRLMGKARKSVIHLVFQFTQLFQPGHFKFHFQNLKTKPDRRPFCLCFSIKILNK